MTIKNQNIDHPGLIKPCRGMPESIAVIGAGTIGPDIGYYLKSALPDLRLVLIDIHDEALENARARISKYIKKGIDRGKISPDMADKIGSNIVTSIDYAAITGCENQYC